MKKIIALTFALLMTASFTACGSKTETAPSSSADTSSAASSTASEESTTETPNIDRIKASGKLVMCTNAAFPPFEYVGADGKPTGVDVEIAQAIADDLGVQLEVVDMNFDLLIDSVKAGKADFAAAGMTIKPERLEQVDFSDEYVQSAQYVITKKDSDVSADNLDGLTIAVQEATTGDFYATDELHAKEVLRFKSGIEAGSALSAGKCDAVIIDKLPAESIAANSNGELEVSTQSLTEESYAIAVKKECPDLLEAINKVLNKLVEEGKVDALVTKHMTQA